MKFKRQVILDTRTKWAVDIPDEIPDEDKVRYAWKRVLMLAAKIPKAGKKDLHVQLFPPRDMIRDIDNYQIPQTEEKGDGGSRDT